MSVLAYLYLTKKMSPLACRISPSKCSDCAIFLKNKYNILFSTLTSIPRSRNSGWCLAECNVSGIVTLKVDVTLWLAPLCDLKKYVRCKAFFMPALLTLHSTMGKISFSSCCLMKINQLLESRYFFRARITWLLTAHFILYVRSST